MRNIHKEYILAIVLLSVVLKVIFLFASGVYQAPQPFEYEQVAENLLDEKGFFYEHNNTRYYAGIAPGYPLLCYFIYRIFGHNTLLVVFLQIFVTSLLVIPIYFIARQIFNERTALLAAILCAIQPQIIVYSTSKLHSMNIYAFVFGCLVLSFLQLKKSPILRNVIITGFIAGLAALFRVTSLLFIFLGMIWFYFTARYESKEKFRIVIVLVLMLFILILPWGIRNYIVFGRPLMLQTNKWESLWFGNMPGSSGSLFTESGITVFEEGRSSLPRNFFEMNEIKQGEYLKSLTIGYFRKVPFSFARKILKKIYYFWYFSPYQGTLYPKLWMRIYKYYYLLILIPAVFSIIYNFTINKNVDRNAILLIIILFLTITVVHSLYFVEGRHRWSIESVLLIFTANGFILLKDYCANTIKRRRII